MSQIATTHPKPAAETAPVLFIRPSSGWMAINLRELWQFRELIYFLTWRDVKVRYKQTALGAAWAIIQPFITMVVFTLIFNRMAKVDSGNIPYPIFSYVGLLPWGLFTKALTETGRSLVAHRAMITKIYFPRLIIPLSSVLGGVVDFLIQLVILLLMMVYYKVMPTVAGWTLPLFLLLAIITALGFGLWLSALNVLYRDVNYILPFLTQIWLLVTPVAYAAREIPARWQMIYALNPMVGVVEGFRWALLGTQTMQWNILAISVVISIILLITGALYFRRMERTFADMI